MSEICIIIPCYNESKRLPFEEFYSFISCHDISFCFIDDGSTDNTYQVLDLLRTKQENKVIIIQNTTNLGKAESVRKGINYALQEKNYKYVGYFDADLATPLSEIIHFMQYFKENEKFGFALGSRFKRLGAQIERSAVRHYLGRIFATFASLILNLPVYDTQCGAKIIKRDIAQQLFDKPFISKWLFDIELIARVKAENPIDIFIEIPLLEWKEIGNTKIKLQEIFKFPLELIRIHSFYKNK